MFNYPLIFAKLGLGLITLVFQINLMGKGNLAPTSAVDAVQNYVLGGIIGGVIYNDSIGLLPYFLILIMWTILVMTLKFIKSNSRLIKVLVDGKPIIVIEKGHIFTDRCMRYGISAYDLHLKLRNAGVQQVSQVKRAVLEQNGQLSVVQEGEENLRFPLVMDGQVDEDLLEWIGRDKQWLSQEIRRQGYELPAVYLAEYIDGNVIIHPYAR